MFPGPWQVRQLLENHLAQRFWQKVVAAYTKGNFEDSFQHLAGHGEMRVQMFKTPGYDNFKD